MAAGEECLLNYCLGLFGSVFYIQRLPSDLTVYLQRDTLYLDFKYPFQAEGPRQESLLHFLRKKLVALFFFPSGSFPHFF